MSQHRRHALEKQIAHLAARGALLPRDARTLCSQLHNSTSGAWDAVDLRLKQLARNWNPYHDEEQVTAGDKKEEKQKKFKTGIKTEKMELDLYQVLALDSSVHVTGDDVKRQFRKLALLVHPDKSRRTGQVKRDWEGPADEQVVDGLRDVTEFARLRVAYETLIDPVRRAAYDAKRLEGSRLQRHELVGEVVKDQVKLEASTDFASLEWMARVKHKMDVMARLAEWAKLLSLDATELRFETGEPCTGNGCGKIVSMDRDLECSGSSRRRVYICLFHKYIHACDERCTSAAGDAELDWRVCPMRAYWLVQNWLFDQLQNSMSQQQQTKGLHLDVAAKGNQSGQPVRGEVKRDVGREPFAALNEEKDAPVCELQSSEIFLGDQYTRFHLDKLEECESRDCRGRFQFLEEGIYACRRHGTPHICTFEQCDRQELHEGSYICWVSGKVYGHEREQVGTDVRTRRVVYSDAQGDESFVEMEVPVMLPLGKPTGVLLEGDPSFQRSDNVSSLSPPPPDEKAWNKQSLASSNGWADCAWSKKRDVQKSSDGHRERETSLVRERLHERLTSKMEKTATRSFHIFLKLPPPVAILPKVALELEEATGSSNEDDLSTKGSSSSRVNLLQIFVHSHHTVSYIKYWMEELTEQQLSIWDQQIYWDDTLIGEEANLMVLEEHGISSGCVLELRLHEDCPLLVSAWTDKNAATGGASGVPVEYNTLQISKEAQEDMGEQQEEWENVVMAEEEAFEESRLRLKRRKLDRLGALEHTEVIQYDNAKSVPRLVGVIQRHAIDDSDNSKHIRQLFAPDANTKAQSEKDGALVSVKSEDLVKDEQAQIPRDAEAMQALSDVARPVKRVKQVQVKQE
uniref:J domain-containing protein n=1 Tax=Peronospora matthiolae TaxID=2874970 RepID=A0AAV1VBB2_9STRA